MEDTYYTPAGEIDADGIRHLEEDIFRGVEGPADRQTFLDTLLSVSGEKHGTILSFDDVAGEPRLLGADDARQDTTTVEEVVEAVTGMGGRAYYTQEHPPSGFVRQKPERSHLYVTADPEWDAERFQELVAKEDHDATAAFHGYPEAEREAFTLDPADEDMVSGWNIHEDYDASEEERARVLSLTNYFVRDTAEAVDARVETANQRYAALEVMEKEHELPDGYLTDVVFSPDEFRE